MRTTDAHSIFVSLARPNSIMSYEMSIREGNESIKYICAYYKGFYVYFLKVTSGLECGH